MSVKGTGIVVFDIDGTFFREHLVMEWFRTMVRRKLLSSEVMRDVRRAERAHQRREGPFSAYANHAIEVLKTQLKGIDVAESVAIGREVIQKQGGLVHIFPRELCAAALEAGFHTAVVSGSPLHAVGPFAERYGIHEALGTTFIQHEDRFTGEVELDWIKESGKARALELLKDRYTLNLKESVAVGDTMGDVPMLEKVGYPICFNPSRELLVVAKERHWPIVVERKDVCYIHTWFGHTQKYQLVDTPNPILPHVLLPLFRPRYEVHFG